MNIDEAKIKNGLKQVISTRKQHRQKLVEQVSSLFLSFCKQNGTLTFPRSYLNDLLEEINVKDSTRKIVVTAIISDLKSKGLIREIDKYTPIYAYRNKTPYCIDYGSFNLLMTKNGYKKHLYKEGFNPHEKSFFKRKIGTAKMGEKLNTELDFNRVETKSSKSRSQQAVYTNAKKSVVLEFKFFSKSKIYEVL